jgi:hypothetical protein
MLSRVLYLCTTPVLLLGRLRALSQSLGWASSGKSERVCHSAYRGLACVCVASQAGRQAVSLHPRRQCVELNQSSPVQPLALLALVAEVIAPKTAVSLYATWLWEQQRNWQRVC